MKQASMEEVRDKQTDRQTLNKEVMHVCQPAYTSDTKKIISKKKKKSESVIKKIIS